MTSRPAPSSPSATAGSDGHRQPACPTIEQTDELTGLRRRLASLPVIEQSKGLLMGYYGIDSDTAFAILVRWSSCTNVKLRCISEELVAAVSDLGPREQPRKALQRAIGEIARTSQRR